jgi:hypothetical protein
MMSARMNDIFPADPEALHPLQVEGFRRMSPARKLQMVADLYAAGIRLRAAGLRLAHPDWTEDELQRQARRSLLHAGT